MATGSIIKDVAKAAKAKAVKGIGNAVFGKGLVGGALNKTFQNKFGDQEESTEVADALKEQEGVQDNNNATLTRLEKIVMNIADNIYNIAGVLNAQVVSMKEAHRLQQERAFKNAAASEEATSEALKVEGPAPAATESSTKAPEKKGGITDLIGSVLSTKKIFKGFLKKFAVFAAGVTAVGLAGFAASTLMSKKDTEENPEALEGGAPPAGPNEPQIISSTPPGAAVPGAAPSAAASTNQQSTSPLTTPTAGPSPASVPGIPASAPPANSTAAVSGMPALAPQVSTAPGVTSGMPASVPPVSTAPAATLGNTPSASAPMRAPGPSAAPSAPTPAAPPPPPAATAIPLTTENQKLKEWFDKPENAADKAVLDESNNKLQAAKQGIAQAEYGIKINTSPADVAKNKDLLDFFKSAESQIREQKTTILNKARKATGQPEKAAGATPSAAPGVAAAPGAVPTPAGGGSDMGGGAVGAASAGGGGAPGATPVGGGGGAPGGAPAGGGGGGAPGAAPVGGGGGGGAPGAAPAGGGGGASAVPPSPSSGASIGAASTAVAVASENTPPKVSSTQINNDTSSGDTPAPTAIPSPIAGRGSLDVGTIFGSGS